MSIEALLLPLFRRQAKPITAADAHKMLGCKQASIGVRMTRAEMARKGHCAASCKEPINARLTGPQRPVQE